MPQSPRSQSDLPSADFGANEWLVEEMYDQYQRDPGSVDQTWVTYFKANGHGATESKAASNGGNGTSAAAAPAKPAPKPASKPAPAATQEHAPDPTPT
ncbi:hypothetical protein ACFP8W_16710, partial [Nocardioides hankookensis]